MDILTEHFRVIWARSLDDFAEAEEDSPFYVELRISEEHKEDMEEFD
jgi:hypothetical protein